MKQGAKTTTPNLPGTQLSAFRNACTGMLTVVLSIAAFIALLWVITFFVRVLAALIGMTA